MKCRKCSKKLTAATLHEHQRQLYCKPCYDIIFNQQVSGSLIPDGVWWANCLHSNPIIHQSGGGDSYQGIVTADEIKRKEMEEMKRLERSKRTKEERRCPTCDKRVTKSMIKFYYSSDCISDIWRWFSGCVRVVLSQRLFEMCWMQQRAWCRDSHDAGWLCHIGILWRRHCANIAIAGPKETDNVFEEEELLPFCKFCFAKRYKMSALNVAESVTIVWNQLCCYSHHFYFIHQQLNYTKIFVF